jgi:hypothetical protein
MLIKLDEHLPRRLVSVLSAFGHDVDTVDIEGLKGADDDSVWTAAQSANRFLITQDLDFSDIRRFRPGTHRGLLLVRLRMPVKPCSIASRLYLAAKTQPAGVAASSLQPTGSCESNGPKGSPSG